MQVTRGPQIQATRVPQVQVTRGPQMQATRGPQMRATRGPHMQDYVDSHTLAPRVEEDICEVDLGWRKQSLDSQARCQSV